MHLMTDCALPMIEAATRSSGGICSLVLPGMVAWVSLDRSVVFRRWPMRLQLKGMSVSAPTGLAAQNLNCGHKDLWVQRQFMPSSASTYSAAFGARVLECGVKQGAPA
jgi:hypothetical protein